MRNVIRHSKRTRLTLIALSALMAIAWAAPAQAFKCRQGQNFAIQSMTSDLYVSTELGWTGASRATLRARKSYPIGPWEIYRCATATNGSTYIMNTANLQWVAAEVGSTTNLRARTSGPLKSWEQFRIRTLFAGTNWELVTLQSVANNKYVRAQQNWSGSQRGTLRASATTYGSWEMFYIYWL